MKIITWRFFFLLLLAIFINSTTSFAQLDFAPVGAKWWHDCLQPEAPGMPYPSDRFYTYESIGDTLLNNREARIIEYREVTKFSNKVVPEAKLIVTSDEDKVYTWIQDSFYLLYDFSAQAGDTLLLRINPIAEYYKGAGDFAIYPQLEPYFRVAIDSVFSVNISNQLLRAYSVKPGYRVDDTYHSMSFGFENTTNIIIEKLGYIGLGGLLGNDLTRALGGPLEGDLRCYHSDSISYEKENLTDCNPLIVGVSEIKDADFIQVFPNPNTNGFFYINSERIENNIASIKILDFFGKVLFYNPQFNLTDSINANILNPGIYFLLIEIKGGEHILKKIVVQ